MIAVFVFYTKGNLAFFPESNHFASGYFCHNVLPKELIFEELKLIQEPYFRKPNLFSIDNKNESDIFNI